MQWNQKLLRILTQRGRSYIADAKLFFWLMMLIGLAGFYVLTAAYAEFEAKWLEVGFFLMCLGVGIVLLMKVIDCIEEE